MVTVDLVSFCRGFVQRFEAHSSYHTLTYAFQSTTTELHKRIGVVKFDSVCYILMNYLSRYVETGGKVQLHIRPTTDLLIITVKGSPIHISPDLTNRLFERYRPVGDSMSPGTDSELYLAREYMTDMDGQLEADYDQVNSVLTFKMTFSVDSVSQRNHIGETEEKVSVKTKKNTSNHRVEENDEFLSLVTNIVEKHIMDSDFSVAMLQYESGMGDKTLYRRLKQLTGLSPVEYIRHVRMNRAALLLREGKFSVSEVMYMVGFSNSSYFSKCFQTVYGVSPVKYKQKIIT